MKKKPIPQNIIRSIFIVTLLCCSELISAQTGVFKTYSDYTSHKMEEMTDDAKMVENRIFSSISKTLKFKSKSGEKINYKPDEIWGFLFKGKLFRCQENDVFSIHDSSKVILYWNGSEAFDRIKHNSFLGYMFNGAYYCLSSDMNSKIYETPIQPSFFKYKLPKYNKSYKRFKEDHPQHEVLFTCIGDDYTYAHVSMCLRTYNQK